MGIAIASQTIRVIFNLNLVPVYFHMGRAILKLGGRRA